MTTKTQRNAPQPVTDAAIAAFEATKAQNDAEHGERTTEAITVLTLASVRGLGERSSLFADDTPVSDNAAIKATLLPEIRQRLAQALDMSQAGVVERQEAATIIAEESAKLYQARRDGIIQADVMNGLLGDIYGYKPKKDGTVSKTPEGNGEVIRKRVQRAMDANLFSVAPTEASRFFDGLTLDSAAGDSGELAEMTVQSVIDATNQGGSLFTAYDNLTKIKAFNRQRIEAAYDPKKILGLHAILSRPESVTEFRANPAIGIAYNKVVELLEAIALLVVDETFEVAETAEAA